MNVVKEESSYFSKMKKEVEDKHIKLAEQTIKAIVDHKDAEISHLNEIIDSLKDEIVSLKKQIKIKNNNE
jgi:peptidoglycan hydrolase CwlO-like protein